MSKKVAWVFPGQGAQAVGMGKELFASSARARAVYERADLALGFDISKLCFEGPAEELQLTSNTQPALVATSIAVLEALRERIPELPLASFAAGHSLGEYSALVASGAMSLEDAISLVHLRGTAMQRAVPAGEGAMLAVMGGTAEGVEQLCNEAREGEVLSAANFNCPGQIVVAGTAAAVERARALAKSHRLKAIPLKVSAPFHCSLMRPAATEVAARLETIRIAQPQFPVIANVDAEPNSAAGRVKELLVRQIDGCVLWQQTVERLLAEGVTHVLELGSGKVLAGLIKKTTSELNTLSVSSPEQLDQVADFIG